MEGLFPPPVCTGDIYIFVKKRKGAGGGPIGAGSRPKHPLTHWQCASLGRSTVHLVPLCSHGALLGAHVVQPFRCLLLGAMSLQERSNKKRF